ncbi:MAG: ATP/GTP-binding protein [Saprospiraceae bacterium]|nr:ATP/GTP-binding protein [Saprospiraceae bacterium]
MTPLKITLLVSALLYLTSSVAQNPQLTKIWETNSTLKVPESVLYHKQGNCLYVSNIDGKSGEKDLKGSITKLSLDGKDTVNNWVTNLSAPKGMGILNNSLYVTDLDEVVEIDITTRKIIQRISVPGSIFLNDLTIDNSGTIYVSDSRTGKVHTIKNKNVATYIENKMGVNGLLAVDTDLYLAVKDTLFKSNKNKELSVITTGMDESSDGIVQTKNKDFIVSCWNGIIYFVKSDGTKNVLLDTRAEKSNTADIGFDAEKNILYVPTFSKNKVVAYQLK